MSVAPTTVNPGANQTSVYNALVPPEGPKAVNLPLDFSVTTSYLVDFTLAYGQTTITVLQTLYIDNFNNNSPVVVTVPSTGQTIEVPAACQGAFPIISAIRPKITLTSAGGVVVNTIWLNVPLPSTVWYRNDGQQSPSTPAAGSAVVITAGGTAVTVFAANAIVNQGLIVNPIEATESLFVDFVHTPATTAPGAYGTTIELQPGGSMPIPPLAVAVYANAATAGHTFTAVRF